MGKFRQFRDDFGRKSPGYHHVHHGRTEDDIAVIDIERSMVRWCNKHGLYYGTCDKYAVAKRMGIYRDYCRALVPKRKSNGLRINSQIDFKD